MAINGQHHSSQDVFLQQVHFATEGRPFHGVGQDKGAAERVRRDSSQPAPRSVGERPRPPVSSVARSQKASTKRKLERVTIWVEREVKAEVDRIARQDGLSVSATGAAFLREAVRQKLHIQHAVLLQPIIEQAIRRQMGALSTRLAWLLVRVAFDAGQTRSLVTNILGRQAGVSPEVLKTILAGSGKSAKANITRRTPQMAELIEAVEHWMVAEEGTPDMTHGDRKSELHPKPGRG
jgi:hypothetical protein